MDKVFENVDSVTSVKEIHSLRIYSGNRKKDSIPFFTIAIPTFNRASTLTETIDSALNQNGFDDYDIIVVDNNPERGDETEVLMNQYRTNPKVTYYKNTQNLGMAGNWNKCALLATSDRFVLLHDDDIISPYFLSVLHCVLCSMKGAWSMIKPALIKFEKIDELLFEKYKSISIQRMHSYNYFGGDCTGAPTAVLFNRNAYIRTDGALRKWYPSFDYVLSYSLSKISPVYKIDAFLGGYRVGINESLSEITMNGFFKKKFEINNIIMGNRFIPIAFKKSILSKRFYEDIEWVRRYYNMPNYTIDISQFELFPKDSLWLRFFNFVYHWFNCITGRLSRRTIFIKSSI